MSDRRVPHGSGQPPATVVLLVDVANVVGSRPDGWWRDRAGAASRLLESLAGLHDMTLPAPDGATELRLVDIVAVVEGTARTATAPNPVEVVSAPYDGDREIVAQAERIVAGGLIPLVVTADRGLRARLPKQAKVAGPEWINRLVGR